eukprot:11502663-Heterocapsa_arctica.AAC.1
MYITAVRKKVNKRGRHCVQPPKRGAARFSCDYQRRLLIAVPYLLPCGLLPSSSKALMGLRVRE